MSGIGDACMYNNRRSSSLTINIVQDSMRISVDPNRTATSDTTGARATVKGGAFLVVGRRFIQPMLFTSPPAPQPFPLVRVTLTAAGSVAPRLLHIGSGTA